MQTRLFPQFTKPSSATTEINKALMHGTIFAPCILFAVLFPSLLSALSVDMAFKIAVIYQLGEDKLFKSRNSARIKSESVIERLDKPFGKNHISDTHGRRNCF